MVRNPEAILEVNWQRSTPLKLGRLPHELRTAQVGDSSGPGIISTDTADPINLRFHCSDSNNGAAATEARR